MNIRIIIVLSLITFCCQSIDRACSSNPECPNNATCSGTYCICNMPYILDCNTQAPLLTNNQQTVSVDNVTNYYQTQQNNAGVYYNFFFQVCYNDTPIPNYDLKFSLYVNTGAPTLGPDNFIGSVSVNLQQLFDSNGQCMDLVQYQIKLDSQPNGQTENLIVGLQLAPLSQADQVNNATTQIGILVLTSQMVSSELLVKLAIGIMSFAVFITLCIIAFCCYQRYKRRKAEQQKLTYHQQQVELFKKNTPQILAKQICIPPMTTCSICLGDFQPESKIRKTVCKHLFHSQCIDSWCMKNLNCPVCRLQLDQHSIKTKQKQYETSGYNWNQNSLSARQQLIQNLNTSVNQNQINTT